MAGGLDPRPARTGPVPGVVITFEELRAVGSDASVRIHGAGDPFDLWFRVRGARPQMEPEALVSAVLPVAMGLGEDIDLGGLRLDPAFAAGTGTWQEAFATWYPDRLRPVDLGSHRSRRGGNRAAGVGCFFTGGVDSFHSVLANRERLTHLVFVHGFDVPLEGLPALRADVTEHVQAAALELGLSLIEVETNLHDFSDTRQSPWGTTYHGVALATVAHLLSGVLGEVLIGATHAYADLFPYGSHPLTDPLLSSSGLRLVHHGCEADRVEKVIACAASPVALRHLRVCWENRDGTYNCGTCKKCLRTMIALEIAGNLEGCATLPHVIGLDQVRALPLGDVNTLARHAELIAHLRALGTQPELLEACEDVVRTYDPAEMRWDPRDWTSALPLLWD
jgi:hypothetical protein